MKKWFLIFPIIIFLCSCKDISFDSEKWKTKEDEQYFMLKDIVKNKRLIGKTKKQIVELLDTTSIKQFSYSTDSWMYVIVIPNAKATQSSVENMYIEFKNGKVNDVEIQN